MSTQYLNSGTFLANSALTAFRLVTISSNLGVGLCATAGVVDGVTQIDAASGDYVTVGFLGKLFIFECAVEQQHWVLVILGVITVAAGFYYYLKVIRAMYWQQPADPDAPEIEVSGLAKLTIATLCALIIWLGVYPAPLLSLLP